MLEKIKNFANDTKNERYVSIVLIVLVLMIALLLSSGRPRTEKKPQSETADQILYVAEMNGRDTVVDEDGRVAYGYTLDKKGNIVSEESKKAVVKKKDVQKAIIIEVEVTPIPVAQEPVNLNPQEEKSEFPFAAKISKAGVRLRSLATTEARILKEFAEGESVEVIDVEGEWYKVRCGTLEGFVVNSYVLKVR